MHLPLCMEDQLTKALNQKSGLFQSFVDININIDIDIFYYPSTRV